MYSILYASLPPEAFADAVLRAAPAAVRSMQERFGQTLSPVPMSSPSISNLDKEIP
jgi:hypothetical protein